MNPFTDVAEKSFTVETPQGQGNTTFNSVGIGTGSKVFRADSSGIWLGAAEFANAPFRVDMDGNATASSLTITGYVQEIGGTYTSASGTGARVQLLPDANTGIVGYDSTNAKVFEVVVGGTNSGDVTLGNYGANKGIFWDDSAATLDIKGNISAGNISGVAITGSSLSTGTSGSRVTMDTSGDNVQFYDSGGDEGLRVGLESSTGALIQSKDSRNLRLVSVTGLVQFGNADLGQLGDISTSGTISAGTFSGGSHTGTGSFSSISMSGDIDMNTQSVREIDALNFIQRSGTPSDAGSWGQWAHSSDGKYQMRVRLNGANYSQDLTPR